MNKLRNLFAAIAVLGIVGLFSACTEETYVTITVNPETITTAPGTVVTFVYTLTPDAINNGELGDFYIDQADGTNLHTESYSGGNSITDSIDITIPNNATVGTDIVLTFRAIDGKSGMEKSKTVTITVEAGYPDIVSVTGKTIDYNSTSSTTNFGFIVGTGDVTVAQVNSNDADFCYFWNDAYRHQILSPNAQQIENQDAYSTWSYDLTGKKVTKIAEYTAKYTWEELNDSIVNSYSVTSEVHPGGGNGVYATNITGKIYAFELADGRKGFLKVTGTTQPYFKAPIVESTITVDFKFQATAGSAK